MKSDSVKGRPSVGSWNSPESPSGAANSQIHEDPGWPLPIALAFPRGCRSPSHGKEAGLSTSGSPRQAEGGVDKCPLRSSGVYTVQGLLLTLPILGPNVPAWKVTTDRLLPRSLLPSLQGCFLLCLLRTGWRCHTVPSAGFPRLVWYQGASRSRGCQGLPSIFWDEVSTSPELTSVDRRVRFPLL